jgi:hypothetical protein
VTPGFDNLDEAEAMLVAVEDAAGASASFGGILSAKRHGNDKLQWVASHRSDPGGFHFPVELIQQ